MMSKGNFGGGTGTYADPLLIEDIEDLAKISSINKYFKLANDIDASKEAMADAGLFADGKGWVPIGTSASFPGSVSFVGLKGLDFNMKKVKNLYINRSDEDNVGFFGFVADYNKDINFLIKRPYFENADVKGKNNVGIFIANFISSSSTYRVYIDGLCCKGKVSGINNVGGAIGNFCPYYSAAYAKNIYCEVEVSGESYVGGVIGNAPNTSSGSSITLCLAKGKVSGASLVGGIVGSSVITTISKCYGLLESITRSYGSTTTFGRIAGSCPASYLSDNKAISTMKFLS